VSENVPENESVTQFPLKEFLGLEIVDGPVAGSVEAIIAITDQHLNPNGVVHGGVIFSLIDTAMGAATMRVLEEGCHCATVEIQTRFIRAASSGTLRGSASVIRRGRHLVHVQSEVLNDLGQIVAMGTGTFTIMYPA
jgi:acyl-CoA thioesterase